MYLVTQLYHRTVQCALIRSSEQLGKHLIPAEMIAKRGCRKFLRSPRQSCMFWTQINVWWTYSQFSWQLCGMASANTELGVNLTSSLMRHMSTLKIRVAKYLTSSSQEHTQDLNIVLWLPFQGWVYQRNEPLYHSMDYMWTALGERTKANLKCNGYALNIFRRRLNSL